MNLLRIVELLVEQINVNLVAKQIKIRLDKEAAKYILEKPAATAATVPGLCAVLSRSTSKIHYPKR